MPPGKHCYIDLKTFIPSLTTLKGCTIYFDLYTNSLVNFYFGCNSSGAGQMFRLETRPGNGTGFATTTNWTVRTAPQGTFVLTASTWYNFVITISTTGVASYTYKLNSATNFSSGSGTITIGNNTHIGVQGDGLGPLSYIDNLNVVS